MADRVNPNDDDETVTGAGDEQLRGVANEDDGEFEEGEDSDEEDEDEGASTF